jgi:hypothetical protein
MSEPRDSVHSKPRRWRWKAMFGVVLLLIGVGWFAVEIWFELGSMTVGGRIVAAVDQWRIDGGPFGDHANVTSKRAWYEYEDAAGLRHEAEAVTRVTVKAGDPITVRYLKRWPDVSRIGGFEAFHWILSILCALIGIVLLRFPSRTTAVQSIALPPDQ